MYSLKKLCCDTQGKKGQKLSFNDPEGPVKSGQPYGAKVYNKRLQKEGLQMLPLHWK